MKNITTLTEGKILNRGAGAGVFSPKDVDQRAREIALIEGRTVPRRDDHKRALGELRGRDLPPLSDSDGAGSGGMTRDPSQPVTQFGREQPNREGPDEQKVMERLVTEGVEEAQHEQMVEAERKARKNPE